MSKTIYLLRNYNNYYNRIIKKHDSVSDYLTYDEEGNPNYAVRGDSNKIPSIEVGGYCNFNINDGITGQITYNYKEDQPWQPDYVVIAEYGSNTPSSRWFVMEAIRIRKGQYQLNLRRDVVADNYNNILTAPTFIEKATLNKTNPFIFNPENMTYNQIKSEQEILLKDETQVPWIVGYVATPQTGESYTNLSGDIGAEVDLVVNNLSDLPSEFTSSGNLVYSYSLDNSQLSFTANGSDGSTAQRFHVYCPYSDLDSSGVTVTTDDNPTLTLYAYKTKSDNVATVKGNMRTAMFFAAPATVKTMMRTVVEAEGNKTQSYINNLISRYNKKVVLVSSTGKYYNLEATKGSVRTDAMIQVTSSYPDLYNKMEGISGSAFLANSGTNRLYQIRNIEKTSYVFKYTETSAPKKKVKVSVHPDRNILIDNPYCMFAIPAYTFSYVDKNGATKVCDKDYSFGAARVIAEKLGGAIYDLQLLPYCPKRNMILADGTFSIQPDRFLEHVDFEYIKGILSGDESAQSILLWCNKSQDEFDISVNISVPDDSIDFKVEDETTFYRLSSPNYAAQYEFSATKNYGVDYVNVDYAYKPYTPYIHANINFKGLYGDDTNDTRGLICSGDFSLPQTSDQWAQYEINNKNYQNSFNRQIENMKFTHKYDMIEGGINAITGAIGVGTAAGMAAGSVNPVAGGIVGGVAGAVSLGAGVADQFIARDKFKETINYTKDQFGFELGNVKARPDTLSKVSAYNPNNKVFLFIEKYTCTKEEKDALRYKLYYNGMSVGVIGKISDYIQEEETYIKGKIIRLEGLSDDFHMSTEIADEINKGVFIK